MKQEKVRTRKQTALRRLNQLFTVVLIAAVYCGANLGPRQAARDIAEHLDMDPYNTVRYQEIHLLGYDRAGTVIADEEVRWASWSS